MQREKVWSEQGIYTEALNLYSLLVWYKPDCVKG